jgi:hypothetical protein
MRRAMSMSVAMVAAGDVSMPLLMLSSGRLGLLSGGSRDGEIIVSLALE